MVAMLNQLVQADKVVWDWQEHPGKGVPYDDPNDLQCLFDD